MVASFRAAHGSQNGARGAAFGSKGAERLPCPPIGDAAAVKKGMPGIGNAYGTRPRRRDFGARRLVRNSVATSAAQRAIPLLPSPCWRHLLATPPAAFCRE